MLRPKLFVKEIIKYWISGGKIYAKNNFYGGLTIVIVLKRNN